MAHNGSILEPEDAHYTVGAWTLRTAATDWAPARGSLYAEPATGLELLARDFPTSKTTQCMSAKVQVPVWAPTGLKPPFFGFASGGVPIIGIGWTRDTGFTPYRYYFNLYKWDASGSAWALLATSSEYFAEGGSFRFDLKIEDYGATSRVRLWRRFCGATMYVYSSPHGSPIIDYSGDTTVTGMDLDGMFIAPFSTWTNIGCAFCCDEDTHRMEIFPKAINGAGDVNTMASGTFADIDEATADTTDYVESDTVGQKITCATAALPAGALGVIGWQTSALVSIGETGPTDSLLGFRTGGDTEDWDDDAHTLGVGWQNISRLMPTTNPDTGNTFTIAEMNLVQIGDKSA